MEEEWAEKASEITKIPVTPYKKDIFIETFGLAWLPYYQVEIAGRLTDLPAFK